MTNAKPKLIAIDIARAIAAIGVFSYHQHIGSLLSIYTKIGFFAYTDAFGAIYAVPLFFLISGYCIHLSGLRYIQLKKPLPLVNYFKRRFLSIYPAYLVAIITSVAVNLITGYGVMPGFRDLLVHLCFAQGFTVNYFNTINLVLWTITIEAAFYLIYPVFYYVRLKYFLRTAMLLTLTVSALSICYFSMQKNVSLPQNYWVGNIWFSWCTGAYIADKLYFNPTVFNEPLFKVIYSFIVVVFMAFSFLNISYLSIVLYQLKILIWTGPLIYLLSKENWLGRKKSLIISVLAGIGLSSYSLYLLHEPLILLKNYLVHICLPRKFQEAGLVAGVIIIPVIAWLNYSFVEKPFINKIPAAKT